MVILYTAGECISAAFVEAALIQKFKGIWDMIQCFLVLMLVSSLHDLNQWPKACWIDHAEVGPQLLEKGTMRVHECHHLWI